MQLPGAVREQAVRRTEWREHQFGQAVATDTLPLSTTRGSLGSEGHYVSYDQRIGWLWLSSRGAAHTSKRRSSWCTQSN
jgi:hypothetical protein